jgi:protocatechuate 3,4-dioxygenase beta subunit
MTDHLLSRRQTLKLAAATAIAGCTLGDEPPQSGPIAADTDTDTNNLDSDSDQTADSDTEPPTCILTPEQTAGPFYFDPNLDRSDIREDRDGTLLTISLSVVDVNGCTPVQGVTVELWHADALGLYSGYPNQGDGQDVDTTGETFLRGRQITAATGDVTFTTVYPGWYPGRATHLHIKVHHNGTTYVTTQLYLSDAQTDIAYEHAAYVDRNPRSTRNQDDRFYTGDGEGDLLLLDTVESSGAFTATGTVGLHTS